MEIFNEVLSVTDTNRLAKTLLEQEFPVLCVEGEISNITYHPSGHLYFTIKDNFSVLKAVMFNYRKRDIATDLTHGDSVRLFGKLTIYEGTGQYQILCNSIDRGLSQGLLHKKFLEIKERLSSKGYFDEDRKKSIPFSTHIGVVTADQGAAIKDIISTAQSRFDNINITLFPSKVQGDDAEKSIIEGIEHLNNIEDIDVIIVGRGGGSYEDLNVFNSENIAEAIYNSKKPIISAVGHEVDFTISDFVADLRAATPTQAAVLATVDKNKIISNLKNRESVLSSYLSSLSEFWHKKLESLETILRRDLNSVVSSSKERLSYLEDSYVIKNFLYIVKERYLDLSSLENRLLKEINLNVEREKADLIRLSTILEGLNPIKVLSRGYSITEANGKAVVSYKNVKKNDKILTRFSDGIVESVVTSKRKK